jgi:hypothetical protein
MSSKLTPEEEKIRELESQDRRLIYDDKNHLNEVMKEIVSMYQKEGYDNFEEISMYTKLKSEKLTMEYKPIPYKHKPTILLTPTEEKILKMETKIKVNKVQELNNFMDDIISQSQILEWAGISFNKVEWYKIRIALKTLLQKNDCEYIRFFGKIFGQDSDYYIIQGLPKKYKYENAPPGKYVEKKGNEGINRYTFWVSDCLLENWRELPEITHEQIVQSRLFKYIFTGDLNSKVKSFYPFNGKEMHLLKCQIIRILHSSTICPKDYLKPIEDENLNKDSLEGKIYIYNDEFKNTPISFDEIKDPEFGAWLHEYPFIYDNGKVIDPTQEAQMERMKGIAEDTGYKIKEGEGDEANEIDVKFWKIKVIGDQMVYNKASGEGVVHATVVIRNERWPGAYTVWKEQMFCNIYVGFGVKATGESYYPTQLGSVDKDPEDTLEQPEPNPSKEPVIPEPDTDDEKKEGEEGE